MSAQRWCVLLLISFTLLVVIQGEQQQSEIDNTNSNKQNNNKNNNRKKKKNKNKRIRVKEVDINFDMPEIVQAKSTDMVELPGGEYAFGSQFHFENDKFTSPKVFILTYSYYVE